MEMKNKYYYKDNEKGSNILKRRIFTILALVLIIISVIRETKTIDAADLVVEKLGGMPESAEIIVSDEKNSYKLFGKNLDLFMEYLDGIKIRKILFVKNSSYSVQKNVEENYYFNIKTAVNDSGGYNAQTIYLNLGANGKLYLRTHMENTYRIVEPDSLKGLYELLKSLNVQD